MCTLNSKNPVQSERIGAIKKAPSFCGHRAFFKKIISLYLLKSKGLLLGV
jgi:hypothetical protein